MEQVIVRDRTVLDASVSEAFEIFAQLQALMCYPLSSQEERGRIAGGICADLIEQQCELQPEIAETLRADFPQYRKSLNRISLGTQGERWGEALIAGWYFLRRLDPASMGKRPDLVDGTSKASGRDILREMFPPRENGFEEDYESRLHDLEKHLIRRHYPVAHLAAAFQAAAHATSPDGQAGEFEIHNLAFLRAVVNLASGFAEAIRGAPELKKIADQLIDLEWRE
ncbi:MAG TPA: hypothetical protein VJ846_06380 [Sphingomicrobium sp.]|nr:hypothetical protein [Sphingomicrobium sp.]